VVQAFASLRVLRASAVKGLIIFSNLKSKIRNRLIWFRFGSKKSGDTVIQLEPIYGSARILRYEDA